MTRRMSLMAFMMTGPTGHHHGMWRHPETDNNFLEPYWYEHIARVLEQGCFDALFFADSLEPFRKVVIQAERVAVMRLSMMRIMARRMNAAALRA